MIQLIKHDPANNIYIHSSSNIENMISVLKSYSDYYPHIIEYRNRNNGTVYFSTLARVNMGTDWYIIHCIEMVAPIPPAKKSSSHQLVTTLARLMETVHHSSLYLLDGTEEWDKHQVDNLAIASHGLRYQIEPIVPSTTPIDQRNTVASVDYNILAPSINISDYINDDIQAGLTNLNLTGLDFGSPGSIRIQDLPF